ncbi:MAG: DUF6807 family protein, partial [Pirellulaceae bacterium]
MKSANRIVWALALIGVFNAVATLSAVAAPLEISVSAGQHDRRNTPVRIALDLPKAHAKETVARLSGADGQQLIGQLTAPGLLNMPDSDDQEHVARELHFILPSLDADQTAKFTVQPGGGPTAGPAFVWQDNEGLYSELHYGERPVLRYMYRAFDDSTPEKRFLTYKVFHHLFDQSGERIVTNGPDGQSGYDSKQILFPHHRGIFYGFNKCSYSGVERADVWHCQRDDHQSHGGLQAREAGPVVGRHRVVVDWHGKGKQVFAKEQREIAVYHLPDGRLVEFSSVLSSEVGPLKLDGDPQHAGFQFRAHNEVAAKTKGQTYYVRDDGQGKPGETRNWPQDKSQADLAWKGISFVLGDKRYTCAYLDKPTNPKEARFSERDYGRFGSYFEYELDTGQTLAVNYRLWFQDGELTGEQIQS